MDTIPHTDMETPVVSGDDPMESTVHTRCAGAHDFDIESHPVSFEPIRLQAAEVCGACEQFR
eukprot:3460155-Prorocentrum_lima.AAC.1